MELHIDPRNSIKSLKTEINRYYPHLKLEFFKKDHNVGEGTSEAVKVEDSATIADLQKSPTPGALSVDGSLTVAELEELFETKFDLHVQVYRQSGDLWLQTTLTDSWTLAESENHASEMSD